MSSTSTASQQKAGVLLSYLNSLTQVVIGIIYVPMLLNGIGQVEYGLYQFVGSVASYIFSIGGILSAGVTRYYCKYMSEGNSDMMENTLAIAQRLYWIFSALGLIVFIGVIYIVRVVYANAYTPHQLDECAIMLLLLCGNMIVSMNNSVNVAAITGHERFFYLKMTQYLALIVQPFIVFVGLFIWPNSVMVTSVILLTNVLYALSLRIYSKGVLKVRYTYHGWDRELAINLIKFSGAILLVTIGDQVFWNSGQLIIGYQIGAAAVAVFAVGAQVYKGFMPLGLAVSSVFLPEVSRLYFKDQDMDAISDVFVKVGRLTSYVLMLVLTGFILFGRQFVELWAGPGFEEAYWVAVIVMIPYMIDLIQTVGVTILQVMNKYYFRGWVFVGLAVVNIALSVYLVSVQGIIGAAIATAISFLIGNGFVMNWYYWKKIGLDVPRFWREMARTLLPQIVFCVVATFVWGWLVPGSTTWGILVAGILVYTVLFMGVSYFCCANKYEKQLLRSFFKRGSSAADAADSQQDAADTQQDVADIQDAADTQSETGSGTGDTQQDAADAQTGTSQDRDA